MNIKKIKKNIKKLSKTQKITICLSGIILCTILFLIACFIALIITVTLHSTLDHTTYMELIKWLILCGITVVIIGCVIIAASLGIRLLKKK